MKNRRNSAAETYNIIPSILRLFLTPCLRFTASLLLILFFTCPASAEDFANISADHLEYLSQSHIYIARGSVKITFEDASLSADEVRLDGNTYDAVAVGNVTYQDPEAFITAGKIELNLKTKIGIIYESDVFYKKNDFHLRSGEIRKTGEKTFFLHKATLTTCDTESPAWHISAKDISVAQHEKITGWHGIFNIKDTPVLYTPYFWVPLLRERQTGLIFPSFGYSSTRGYYYKQGFFWAIKENQDATVYLDYYGQKGFGEGLDYRYILTPESNGELWMYHIRDKQPTRSLAEIKSYHNQEFPYNISAYLKVHAVTYHDYYETMDSTSYGRFGLSSWNPARFGIASEERLQKYLESDMQISKQYYNGRIYLLARGRQSLEGSSGEIPQSLPEIGFILNTRSKSFFSYNAAFRAVNFWQKEGQGGTRFDIHPNLYFSYGRLLNVTQRISMRETVYFLNEPDKYEDRFLYDLGTTLTTRFFKRYSSFIHIVEPFLEYSYTPAVNQNDIPVFDSTDSISKTNNINYSFSNIFTGFAYSGLEGKFIISQRYNFLDADKPFTPLLAEGNLSSKRTSFSINASYDVYDRIVTETIASVKFNGKKGFVGLGKNFRRSTGLDQFTAEAGINSPVEIYGKSLPVSFSGKLWYDIKGNGVQQLNISSVYTSQCWGLIVSFTRKPDEYQVFFGFQIKGIGTAGMGYPNMPIVFSDPSGKSLSVDPYSKDGYRGMSF